MGDPRRRILWLTGLATGFMAAFLGLLLYAAFGTWNGASEPVSSPPGTIPHWTGMGIAIMSIGFGVLLAVLLFGASVVTFSRVVRGVANAGTTSLAWLCIVLGAIFLIEGSVFYSDGGTWREMTLIAFSSSWLASGVALLWASRRPKVLDPQLTQPT